MGIDTQLVEAAHQGDARALDQLLVILQPDLKRFARRTCANAEDAEEAVQVALWKLHRKLHMLQKLSALAAWMFRIVERECYRLFSLLRKTVPLSQSIEESLHQAPVPHQLRHDLVAAIAALPPHYREILILRDIEELSAPETAAYLNISVAAVKSRLHRARGLMRDHLMAGGYW
ncbi:ECF RNA polymerase sigma factor SigE [compost metagenome]